MRSDKRHPSRLPGHADELDDLTVIEGVGHALQRWFRTSFGVRTYRDLAALSRDVVESRSAAEGRRIPAGRVRNILNHAKKLARATAPPRQQEASMADRRRVDTNPRRADAEWQEFASFIVYFERKVQDGVEERRTSVEQRTAVHHLETSEQSPQWPGIAVDNACHWMLSRLPHGDLAITKTQSHDAPAPSASTDAAASSVPPSPTTMGSATDSKPSTPVAAGRTVPAMIRVDVEEVRVYQPPRNQTPQVMREKGRTFPTFVTANAPLGLEAALVVESEGASTEAGEPWVCDVAFQVRNLITAAVTPLGNVPSQIGDGRGVARVPVVGLPPGEYRVQISVTGRNGRAERLGVGYGEVPFLKAT